MNLGEVTMKLTQNTAHFLTYTSEGGEFQLLVNRVLAYGSAFPLKAPPAQIEVKVWVDAPESVG